MIREKNIFHVYNIRDLQINIAGGYTLYTYRVVSAAADAAAAHVNSIIAFITLTQITRPIAITRASFDACLLSVNMFFQNHYNRRFAYAAATLFSYVIIITLDFYREDTIPLDSIFAATRKIYTLLQD